MTCFYAFGASDPPRDLVVRHATLRGIVPADLVAFPHDDRRELLCVGVTGPRAGAVYLVRIPRERHTPVPPRLLAPTFAAFLDHGRVPSKSPDEMPADRGRVSSRGG